ncbi:MAG: hypothetical protein Q9222_006186 [Ikaeria aurantiellina]
MSQLPLKIRIGIRDHWDTKDSEVRKSLAKLQGFLALSVNILIDFPILWDELQKQYPSQDTFAQDILGLVKTWADDLKLRLQDKKYTAWTEQFLAMIGRSLVARVDALPVNRVKATWEASGSFVIAIPTSPQTYDSLSTNFAEDFDTLFPTAASTTKGNDESEGAEVGMPSRSQPPVNAAPRGLPSLNTLDRPEILFSAQTPLLMINFQQSLFGCSPLRDSIELSPYDPRAFMGIMNPLFILSFVESVLGYQSVPQSSDANQWYFKRDTPYG